MQNPEVFDALNASQEGHSLQAWLGKQTVNPHYPEDALDLVLVRAYQNAGDVDAIAADLRYCREQLDRAIKALQPFVEEAK